MHVARTFPGDADTGTFDGTFVKVISSVDSTDRHGFIGTNTVGVVLGSSARSISNDGHSSTSSITAVIISGSVSSTYWVVGLVFTFVLTRVHLSVVQVTSLVSFLRDSLTVEFTLVLVSDIIDSTDWKVHIQTIASFSLLSRTSSIRLFLSSSTSHEAFVIISLTVIATDFLNSSLAEETLIHGVLITDSFMEFGDSKTIGFALVIVCSSVTSANWFEVMSASTFIFAESASSNGSVDALGDTLILIGSLVDSTDRIACVDFERTNTTLRSRPLVIVVSTFSILNSLDVGALGTTHVSISHSITSTNREQ
jgi:hypothetical protein